MKIAKLSLVAAVAVAGLSTANAQPLEQAIKDVDVSGSVVYRYNDNNDDSYGIKDNGTSKTNNNYKIGTTLSSKVNDDVKAVTRFLVSSATGDFAALDNQAEGDGNVDVELSNVYFQYTGLKNTTVNVGKQGLTTPWTTAVDSDGNEQTGTGILALTTQGPVTLAAAYFNQTNLGVSGNGLPKALDLTKTELNTQAKVDALNDETSSLSVATVGAIATLGPVTADAWYLDMENLFDTFTVGAKADFDVSDVKLGVDARYASLDLDDADTDNAMAKIALTAKAGIVSGKVAYAMTDKEGGLTALDNDASTTLLGWNLNANGKADADYWQATVAVDLLSNVNLSANYGNIEYVSGSTDEEEEEVYAQLTYKMSKNLSSYVRYGEYTKDKDNAETNDQTAGRLQVEYTL